MVLLCLACSTRRSESAEQAPGVSADLSKARAEPPRAAMRQLIRTVTLAIHVETLPEARRRTEQWIEAAGGFVEALDSSNFGSARTLSFTLRVPKEKLDAVIEQLRGLGSVQHETQSVDDVTRKYVDSDARLRNLETTEQRLLALLGKQDGSLTDVLAVERELSRVREEVEVLSADFRTLKEQISLSTIKLSLSMESEAEPPASVWTPWRKLWRNAGGMFGESVGALLGFGAWLVGAVIHLLPWSPVLVLVWLGMRRWRAKRRARKAARSAPSV